jgi:hypothetical protein
MTQRWGVPNLILQRINTCLLNQVFIRIYRNALWLNSNKQTQVFWVNEPFLMQIVVLYWSNNDAQLAVGRLNADKRN